MRPLREQWEATGRWLFRNRSWCPLVLLPLLVIEMAAVAPARTPHRGWEVFCLLVSLAGLALRAGIVGYAPRGTSHRTTGSPKAASLNTSGFYSILRHPLYLANMIMWLGVALWPRSVHFAVIVLLAFWIYYERIMFAEEEYLRRRFGDEFIEWARRTPAFLPRPRLWRRPAEPFSPRLALRREISGLLAVVTIFPALVYARDLLDGDVRYHPGWTALFIAGLLIFLAVVYLMRRTKVLSVRGR